MILEVALLHVKKGYERDFEQDFHRASQYISSIEGYKGHSLRKCVEQEGKYILLVDWVDIDSHEINFRKSPQYLEWKALLHAYYDPFPIVEHYETIYENINQ